VGGSPDPGAEPMLSIGPSTKVFLRPGGTDQERRKRGDALNISPTLIGFIIVNLAITPTLIGDE
jgi:hypothetical protein